MALDKLVVGDTLYFEDEAPDFPPTAGWTLKYRLIPQFSTPTQAPITLTATTSGSTYLIQASPATTATWVAGRYSWARWVEKSGARHTFDPDGNANAPLAAFLELLPDPTARAQGYDPRSPARKALDAINAVLDTWGTNSHIQEYTIGSRSMRFATKADAVVMRDSIKAEVWREEATAAMASGQPNPRQVRVRMSRV
jgi:hypothetical protein